MKGARRYANLFKTGQYGKLYLTSGSHARGRTFTIQVLPEGVKAKPNGSNNNCINSDAVEVYGMVSGQRGWTETYGWLHDGKWQADFCSLVKVAEDANVEKRANHAKSVRRREAEKQESVKQLLSNY